MKTVLQFLYLIFGLAFVATFCLVSACIVSAPFKSPPLMSFPEFLVALASCLLFMIITVIISNALSKPNTKQLETELSDIEKELALVNTRLESAIIEDQSRN